VAVWEGVPEARSRNSARQGDACCLTLSCQGSARSRKTIMQACTATFASSGSTQKQPHPLTDVPVLLKT
jgi:hypothetical protein